MSRPLERANLVCRLATAAGFDRVGIAPAGPVARPDYVLAWLDAGMAGEMSYLGRWRDLRLELGGLLPGARSVIVVAHLYGDESPGATAAESQAGSGSGTPSFTGEGSGEGRFSQSPPPEQVSPPGPTSAIGVPGPATARVARYAWGRDYHDVVRSKLHAVVRELRQAIPEPFETRVCVDTAPLLEREAAAAAGVGWIGKNTMVLHPELGSFFFLGEIVTTLELAPSLPAADHCGTCTRCLEACPTGALTEPYRMDARRCISYLTIEHRSDIPAELRPLMGDWLYGCDICQDVCPHNRKAPAAREAAYLPRDNPLAPDPQVDQVLQMAPEEYREAVAGSAMKRASLEMLQRNARIVRENTSGPHQR